MDRLGTLPLAAQPGEEWIYGYATDVLGCVVERASGLPLDQFFQQRIFAPLRMHHTWFFPPDSVRGRLTAVYAVTPDGALVRAPDGPMGQGDYITGPRQDFAGGAGLVSTAGDYARFLQMLLGGGELDGARILLARHGGIDDRRPGGHAVSRGREWDSGSASRFWSSPGWPGSTAPIGRYGWAGAYGTNYWVDPADDLVVVLMLQALPRRGLDVTDKFRTMVYSALISRARAKGP